MVRMPVGIEDFKALITGGYYFVDKTDLIRRLIDSHGAVTLFARPRRFGKTLTMSMVDYFFNIAHKEEAETLFKGTNIEKAGPVYMKHLGSRPVLFLSLKDVKESDFGNMTARMGRLMAATCQKYHFLLDNPSVLDSEKTYFLRLENQEASPVDLQDSLRTLLDLLSRYYGKQALLLIDEYDAPVQTAWENGYYHEAVSFMRNFLSSALKTNPSLEFALLTGVLRIAKESIFSGLNNLSISTVISGGYADTFGFTKKEIRKMAEILGKTDKLQELSDWYDGYHFQNVEIYNPWSIINYFDQGCIATSYWVNTSGNSILAYLLQSADERRWQEIRDLMAGKSITSGINENVVYDTLNPDRTTLYTVLLFTGYLKCTGLVENRRGLYDLAIPNRELRDVFEDEIISRLGSGNSDIALHDMETAMISGNAESFQTAREQERARIGEHPVFLFVGYYSSQLHTAASPGLYHFPQILAIAEMRVAAKVEFHVRKILHYGHESVEILLFPDLADGKEKLLAVGYESGLPLRLALYVLYAVIDDLQSLPLRI